MLDNDTVRLHHILDAAREALSFSQGHSHKDLYSDRMLSLALVRLLEIIGEAARGVSLTCRATYPEIAWQKMAGMRDRLVHGYFDINLEVVWETVTADLPPMVAQLENIISLEKD